MNSMLSLKTIVTMFMLIFLAGCAGNITVRPYYQPKTKGDTQLASVPSLKIKLMEFEDKRDQRRKEIGQRFAAYDVPMGDVYTGSPITEIVREAVKTELTRNGHVIVADNEDISLKGGILKFWVGTDVTALYWDVIGDISFELEVINPVTDKAVLVGPYNARNVERTYVNPGEGIVTGVLEKSLSGTMLSMSNDPELVKQFSVKFHTQ